MVNCNYTSRVNSSWCYMSLFQSGDFTLASGKESNWKIECDALDEDGWATVAKIFRESIRCDWGDVVGVPTGGEKLANALKAYSVDGAPLLIVDDVWTTGKSMMDFILELNPQEDWFAVVLFARAGTYGWCHAIFRKMEIWAPNIQKGSQILGLMKTLRSNTK